MQSNEIGELAKALAAAQKEIKTAVKDADNPFFKSKYADLTSISEACLSALNKNNLSVVQTIVNGEFYSLKTTLLHSSGQWISGECPLINTKGDMQGLGSAISYARRYSLAAISGVVTEDDDANKAVEKSSAPITNSTRPSDQFCTAKQASLISLKLREKGLTGTEMYAWLQKTFGYLNNTAIPFNRVNDVLAAIEKIKPIKDPSEPPDVAMDIPF